MFFEWQKELWELLQTKPDNRRVIWLYSKKGKIGKTRFCQWVELNQNMKGIVINNVGRMADFTQGIMRELNQGWRGDTVFLNLAKNYCDRTSVYEACEMISDGLITSTKYQGGRIWLNDMHIVVFANFPPQTSCLSEDRWYIREILEGKMRPVTLETAAFNPNYDR